MVAHAFPPQVGGVETHLWDISQHLSWRGYDVRCLVGGVQARDNFGDVEVIRHPFLTVQHLLSERRSFTQHDRSDKLRSDLSIVIGSAIAEFAPDIIHAHNLLHFAPEFAEALYETADGTPIVTSIHDRVGEHLFPEVIAFPWAHTLFASHFLKANLPNCSPSSVLWLGIERQRFQPRGEHDVRFLEMERPIIFIPARLLRWKGIAIGFEAFAVLRTRLGKGTLVLCASEKAATDQEEICALRGEICHRAAEEGISSQVKFIEFSQFEMPAAYRGSDVIWYPTIDDEPLGLGPIEAMACGVPIIVSESGGMRETIISGQTGIAVKKNNATELADATEQVLRNEQLRNLLIDGALERAKLFDNKNYVDELIAVYDRVLRGPHDLKDARQ